MKSTAVWKSPTHSEFVNESLTIHKYQGVSIGIGKDWGAVVVTLPAKHIKNHLRMEPEDFSGPPQKDHLLQYIITSMVSLLRT